MAVIECPNCKGELLIFSNDGFFGGRRSNGCPLCKNTGYCNATPIGLADVKALPVSEAHKNEILRRLSNI